jgi:Zn-dependent peptidase ImmA (M78 family)/transcriptional regulator with XRE-family HTH domain
MVMQQHVLDSIDPKVLGQRLQDSRKTRGLTQESVANELGVARTTITALEKGERRIQPNELVKLARLYGREISDIVSSRQIFGDFAVQFRASINKAGQHQLGLEKAISEFQTLCEDYLSLENICHSILIRNYPTEYATQNINTEEIAEDIATLERHRLGLGDGPINNLRDLMENDIGLRIFYIKLPSHISGMFTYSEELGGCIAINIDHPEERRRWSNAHEYGHFLTKRFQSEISILLASDRIPVSERVADSFAGAFLMPATGLRHRINDLKRQNNDTITPSDLCRLANYYFVSVEALTLRLENLRLIRSGSWELLKTRGFKVREAQQILKLELRHERDQSLPIRYQYLTVEAYQRGDISEGQLARYLRVDRLQARNIVHNLSCTVDVSEDGQLAGISVDFAPKDQLSGGKSTND